MDPDLERVRAEILERIERVETTLLQEFRKWAISFLWANEKDTE
jgi:hypothetical protein